VRYVVYILFVLGALALSVPASAHHSFAATYYEDKTVKIEGELVQFLYRNPHSFVHIEVKEPNGEGPGGLSNGRPAANWPKAALLKTR